MILILSPFMIYVQIKTRSILYQTIVWIQQLWNLIYVFYFRVFPTLIRQKIHVNYTNVCVKYSFWFSTQRVINICIARVSFKRTIFFLLQRVKFYLFATLKCKCVQHFSWYRFMENKWDWMCTLIWVFKSYMQMIIDYFVQSTGLGYVESGHFVFSNNITKTTTLYHWLHPEFPELTFTA